MAVPLPPWPIDSVARLRLGQRDQLALRARADRRVPHDHERNGRDHAHGLEVLHRVEGHLRIEAHVGGERTGRAQAQRVAVGRRLRRQREAHVAAGTGLVVDHHGLAQLLVEPRHQQAHHRVGAAAGREGDDHADRPVREVAADGRCLREGRAAEQRAPRARPA
jgi:hypothetical protein